jgi:hypothetical protein
MKELTEEQRLLNIGVDSALLEQMYANDAGIARLNAEIVTHQAAEAERVRVLDEAIAAKKAIIADLTAQMRKLKYTINVHVQSAQGMQRRRRTCKTAIGRCLNRIKHRQASIRAKLVKAGLREARSKIQDYYRKAGDKAASQTTDPAPV